MSERTLTFVIEREDHSTYMWTPSYNDPVRLVSGETVCANQVVCGDEIESHHSNETGGRGHIVVGDHRRA